MSGLIERRCDDHALLRLVKKLHLCVQRACRAELFHLSDERAHAAAVVFEIDAVVFALAERVTDGTGLGKLALTKRHEAHGARGYLPALLKVEKAYRVKTHIAVVVNGQSKSEAAVVYQVVVPFLDAHGACLDIGTPVDRQELFRKACLGEIAVFVEQGNFT